MPNLLHLDSSIDPANSRSRAITRTFSETWRQAGTQHTVTYRDLHADPIPHLPDAALHWAPRLRAPEAQPPVAAEVLQRELINELLAADVVLIGAPMYNYSLSSSLKAWVDHIHVPGVTTPADTDDRPLAGRHAVVVTSRGGAYDRGTPTEDWDHAVPVLRIVLGEALGMSVSVITTSLTLAESLPDLAEHVDRSRAELSAAHDEAQALAATLSGAHLS
ncbi:NAD(P)H-dependent oxidoreductase [Okibacterium endophyticum]